MRTTTLGWSEGCASYSELDGTGGCLDVVACPDKPMAESCTDLVSTPTIGMPGVDLIAF